jgi:hypothetical protein
MKVSAPYNISACSHIAILNRYTHAKYETLIIYERQYEAIRHGADSLELPRVEGLSLNPSLLRDIDLLLDLATIYPEVRIILRHL